MCFLTVKIIKQEGQQTEVTLMFCSLLSKPKPKPESMNPNPRKGNIRPTNHTSQQGFPKEGNCSSYGQSNNFLALLLHLLYQKNPPLVPIRLAVLPTTLALAAALFKPMSMQLLKFLMCLKYLLTKKNISHVLV